MNGVNGLSGSEVRPEATLMMRSHAGKEESISDPVAALQHTAFYLQSPAAKGQERGQAMEEKQIKTGSWTFK